MNMNLRSTLMGHSAGFAGFANLSDDDATILSLDAAGALHEIETGLTALNRLQDTASTVEDTVFIASNIDNASNVELALLDNALNHLGAGEGVTGDDLHPNMQSYEGGAVNMQSLKSMASSVWQAIKDLIKRIRDRIVKFFKSRWGDSAKLRKRLKSLIARCEKMSGKSIDESKTEIGREIKYVTVAGDIKKSGNHVVELVGKYSTLAGALYENWIREVTAFGSTLETSMDSWDSSASGATADVGKLNIAAGAVKLTDIRGMNKLFISADTNDNRNPAGIGRKRCNLAGNQSVFAADSFDVKGLTTNVEKAKLFAKARVTIEPYNTKPKELEEKGEVETWTVDTVSTLCNELLSVLDVIDRYDDSKYMKDSEKQAEKVMKAGDKLANARQKQDDINSEVDSEAVAYQQYASAYASWSSQGLASFASNFNSMANGLTVIGSKCLSNHK